MRRAVTALRASLAACVFAAGCSRRESASGPRGGSEATVPVVVGKVVRKSMPLTINAVGAVESLRSVAIKSQVTGLIWKVCFNEGQEVKRGDLLFEIDPRPFRNGVSSAEADLLKNEAQLETADAEVARYGALVKQGLVSNEKYQDIQNSERVTRAEHTALVADLANASLQLEYSSIRAPCDGRTGSLGAHEGDLVRASDPNVTLVTITQISPIYVTFAAPQQSFADIRHYMDAGRVFVMAKVSGPRGASERGELVFLDNSVDATTGTIRLKASFGNADRGLWPGQYASVEMTLAMLPDQLVVASTAVQKGQHGYQAYVVRENRTVELRPIAVGLSLGEETVVSRGLREGETVVVDGQIRLRPGTAIESKPAVVDPFKEAP